MSETCYASSGVPIPCQGQGGFGDGSDSPLDPQSRINFTIAWTCTFALVFLLVLPSIIKSFAARSTRCYSSFFGLTDAKNGYTPIQPHSPKAAAARPPTPRTPLAVRYIASVIHNLFRWTPSVPFARSGRAPFSLGALLAVLVMPAYWLACLLPNSNLLANPNRFGYLALAMMPPMFVLAAKNGPINLLLGKSWTAVNFLHRWLGRLMVLSVLMHGILWTIQYRPTHQVGYFISQPKATRGVIALAFLLLIAVSSTRLMRRFSYPAFFVLHYVGIVGFVVSINRHTTYAGPWVTWVIAAIYVFDFVGRIVSMRIRVVEVEPLPHGMTRVRIDGLSDGWRGGQHLPIRLFFVPPSKSVFSWFRTFEQHPFSIANATARDGLLSTSASMPGHGLELFVRDVGPGTWTHDLYEIATRAELVARAKQQRVNVTESSESQPVPMLRMLAMLEGPYGGISQCDLLDQETVLLIAGGSGMSFTLGVLDGLLGSRRRRGVSGTIEVVWVVREKAHVAWFADKLRVLLADQPPESRLMVMLTVHIKRDSTLTNIDRHESMSVDERDALPSLPNTRILYSRPRMSTVINETIQEALSPCGNCWPVCRCGEFSGDGICANDEEICMETLGPANALDFTTGEGSDDKVDKYRETADIYLPSLSPSEKRPALPIASCSTTSSCQKSMSSVQDVSTNTNADSGKGSCCSSEPKLPSKIAGTETTPRARGCMCGPTCCNGGCCCGSRAQAASGQSSLQLPPPAWRPQLQGPQRVRTAGMAVVVCGPASMISETRQAVAQVPIAKQARIGNIHFHAEHYTL